MLLQRRRQNNLRTKNLAAVPGYIQSRILRLPKDQEAVRAKALVLPKKKKYRAGARAYIPNLILMRPKDRGADREKILCLTTQDRLKIFSATIPI